MEAITTALTTGFGSIATEALGAMGSIVPVAVPILGGLLLVGIGRKVFKAVTR